jgi:tetrahydromethanopterin S-methyltransferase subunit B
MKINANIQSGLELMEFELLPDKSDAENLERELSWLESQKSKLFESLDRTEGLRATSESLTNLMSTKMIGFAIVGLVSIIAVNVLFYRELKKTFKERKLI